MAQLVGCNCVICGDRIGDELGARFCAGCHNPVHNACISQPAAGQPSLCQNCGVNLAAAAAKRKQEDLAKQPPASFVGPFPVSERCPKCDHAEYKLVKPNTLVAFRWDRVCRACGTRYTVPTPTWASVLFLLAGLILIVLGFGSVLLGLFLRGELALGPGSICEGFLGVLGVLVVIHGFRSLQPPPNG